MVHTRSCACPTIAVFLGLLLGKGSHALRQCVREWCYDAQDKCGLNRQAVAVTTCFAPLLGWVLRHWSGTRLALALDATTLEDRFVVLTISVVYRGCAIPVAWRVLPAQEKHAWRKEWLVLLRLLRPAVPPGWDVLVLADRGLYARWLFGRIRRVGWHPFLRSTRGGTVQPTGQGRYPLGTLVPRVGTAAAEQDLSRPVTADLTPTPQRPRLVRLFRLGLLTLLVAAITAHPLPLPGRLSTDTWPGDAALAPPDHSTTVHAA